MNRRLALAVVSPLVLLCAGHADADAAKASYAISYLGFVIAKANMAVKTADTGFAARISYKTTGIVKIVSDAKGDADSSGVLKTGKPVPTAYHLKSEEGEHSKDVVIESENGEIKSTSAAPPLKALEKRVPILPQHRKDTLDPLTGALFPIAKADDPLATSNCDRTAPVFDGWTRYDVVFSYKKTVDVKVKGYKGKGLTCAARWVPVAGHRPDQESTKFLAANKDMELTIVPTATGFMLPVSVSIRTMSGPVQITAESIDVR